MLLLGFESSMRRFLQIPLGPAPGDPTSECRCLEQFESVSVERLQDWGRLVNAPYDAEVHDIRTFVTSTAFHLLDMLLLHSRFTSAAGLALYLDSDPRVGAESTAS